MQWITLHLLFLLPFIFLLSSLFRTRCIRNVKRVNRVKSASVSMTRHFRRARPQLKEVSWCAGRRESKNAWIRVESERDRVPQGKAGKDVYFRTNGAPNLNNTTRLRWLPLPPIASLSLSCCPSRLAFIKLEEPLRTLHSPPSFSRVVSSTPMILFQTGKFSGSTIGITSSPYNVSREYFWPQRLVYGAKFGASSENRFYRFF